MGDPNFIDEIGLPLVFEEEVDALEPEARTTVLVGVDDEIVGVISTVDTIKDESFDAIQALYDRGLKTWMITRDNGRTARAIAKQVNIDPIRVMAGVRPQEKIEKVCELPEEGIRCFNGW